jgi:sterol desaturase/sphingolipid hydroxylase (fatty acid hydroxylase superfamily)
MNFETIIIENENIFRMGIFFGLLIIMGLWELRAPRKVSKISKSYRWLNNLSLVFFNGFILKVIFPVASTGMAIIAYKNNWGLLNYYEISPLISLVVFVVVMDLIVYFQHVMVHAVPIFWRLHKVHHIDLDYDTSTGARFHTIEIFLSFIIKLIAIVLLGPSVLAVIIFEVILNATAMFNHGNVGLPSWLDRILKYIIVTPDMHRIHHSIEKDETNSNFGFSISLWDRIFGTYKNDATLSQKNLIIGIKGYTEIKQTNNLFGMLLTPFKNIPNK